jgi:hypothetical protein
MSCERASKLISQSMDRSLTLRERWALRFHLVLCVYCRRYRRQLQLIRDAMRRVMEIERPVSAGGDALSPEARQRIAEVLQQHL